MTTLADLEAAVGRSPSALVAFSGGVDSSLVAAAAARMLGDAAIAVTAVSPSLPAEEHGGAAALAEEWGLGRLAGRLEQLAS